MTVENLAQKMYDMYNHACALYYTEIYGKDFNLKSWSEASDFTRDTWRNIVSVIGLEILANLMAQDRINAAMDETDPNKEV